MQDFDSRAAACSPWLQARGTRCITGSAEQKQRPRRDLGDVAQGLHRRRDHGDGPGGRGGEGRRRREVRPRESFEIPGAEEDRRRGDPRIQRRCGRHEERAEAAARDRDARGIHFRAAQQVVHTEHGRGHGLDEGAPDGGEGAQELPGREPFALAGVGVVEAEQDQSRRPPR